MLILTIRTDKPEAEIGLYDNAAQLSYETWEAHRQLAETLHTKIQKLLAAQAKELTDIGGLVLYYGPGSFTGLRIGISVGNALAASYNLPIVGVAGMEWIASGITRLLHGESDTIVLPDYGSPAFATQPKK